MTRVVDRVRRTAALMLLAACLLPGPSLATERDGQVALARVEAVVEGNLLTLDARNAPLAVVLETIAAKAGFALVMHGDLDRTVTLALDGVAVDRAVRYLVGQESLMMRYCLARPVEVHVRAATGTGVVRIPDVAAAPARRQATGDSVVPEVRRLARQGDASAIAQLARHLERDHDPVVRRLVVESLGEIGEPRVVPALAKALHDDDPSVRRRAIEGLREVGGNLGAAAIGRALRDDPDPAIRQIAARALGSMDHPPTRAALTAAEADPDQEVRAAVAMARARLDGAM